MVIYAPEDQYQLWNLVEEYVRESYHERNLMRFETEPAPAEPEPTPEDDDGDGEGEE